MKIARLAGAIAAFGFAGAAMFWLGAATGRSVPAPQEKTLSVPANADPDVLHFAPGASQLTMVKVEAVAEAPLPASEPLAARLLYDEDVTVRVASSVAGRIVKLLAAPGNSVRAGQALAQIDSPDFGQASADVAKARADEQRKRLAYERARDLLEGGVIAQREYEAAEADLAQARAETRRAMQRMANLNPHGLRTDGERFMLLSPIDGVVSERNANPSMEVNAGLAQPLFVVTDPRRLWLVIDLPERMVAGVAPGAKVEFDCDAFPDRRFTAAVAQVGTVVDPATRRIPVRARVDNAQGQLRPEMFVRAVLLQPGSGLRIPNTGLITDGVYAFAFVQTGPQSFRRTQVRLARRGAQYSYVAEGLHSGDRVVTEGALLLASEMKAAGRS